MIKAIVGANWGDEGKGKITDMIDVSNVPNVNVGDEVIVMGSDGVNSITADDIADATGTINYEITCAFGQRLPKVFVK